MGSGYQPLMRSVLCKYFLRFPSRLSALPMASCAVEKLSESMGPHLFAVGLRSKSLVARPVPGSAVASGVLPFLVSPRLSDPAGTPKRPRFLFRSAVGTPSLSHSAGTREHSLSDGEEREEAFGRGLGRT